MHTRIKTLTLAVAAAMACALSYALVMTRETGDWPSSWPQELEALRAQSRTVEIANGTQETIYEIPFTNREAFEKYWPFILKLKSPGAPIIIEGSPSELINNKMTSGVRVLWPVYQGGPGLPDGTTLKSGPPWPDSIQSATGELPEFVAVKDGKWVRYATNQPMALGFMYRARVDIVLVADGQIVDTNRIQFPAQTPIIDKRAKK